MNILGAMEETVRLAHKSDKFPSSGNLGYAHIAGMLITMKEGTFSYGKMCRWLGWAQCAVVAAGAATLEDMKRINMRYKDPV